MSSGSQSVRDSAHAWDAVVVGAGICGLAAAYELRKRGQRCWCSRPRRPGAGQSQGWARIFRIAHRDERLCALALEAREGWQRWERELGRAPARRRRARAVSNGMWSGGEPLDRAEITRRGCRCWRPTPDDAVCRTRWRGSLRMRPRARRARRDACRSGAPRSPRVDADGTVYAGDERFDRRRRARLRGARHAAADRAARPRPAAHQRAALPPHLHRRHRRLPDLPEHCYALGRNAAATRSGCTSPAPTPGGHVPDLGEPIGAIECVSLFAPWLDHGDGFTVLRAGRVDRARARATR